MHLLVAPDAPTLSGETSDTISIAFTRDPYENEDNFVYYARVYTDSKAQAHNYLCESVTKTCKITGLLPNKGYQFTVKRCSKRPVELCSMESSISEIFDTRPGGKQCMQIV